MSERKKIEAFIRRFSFGTLITSNNNFPTATHLPFIIKEADEKLILFSHIAKQNEQWKDIESGIVLVIFNEPHAYISPTNYEKELNVPTWNYVSVHTYGNGHLITRHEEVVSLLENTIDNYEPSYREQWRRLPEKYKEGEIKGIVAFKIEISEIQAKEKLSQNKSLNEQQKIIDNLSVSKDSNEQIIADYMKDNLKSVWAVGKKN